MYEFVGLKTMQPDKNSRLDTRDLKAHLLKRVGEENFKMYFHCLNRFINQKLSKSEFETSCYRILGRENLSLHNQIIKAILKNACSAETPPPQAHKVAPTTKSCTVPKRSSLVLEDGHGQSSVAPIWSNGVVPMSRRNGRSAIRDRKLRDRPSPLGPNGKSVEDGDLGPLCKLQGLAEQPENDEELVMEKPADISGVFRGNDQSNAVGIKYLEDRERGNQLEFSRSHLIAPLGIPYCSASTGGSRKVLPVTDTGDYVSYFGLGGLSSSETLRRRMEQIAASQGLGVTLECANTLNNMVDVYMKRLISSGLHLVSSRSTSDMSAYPVQKQKIHSKPINGLWPSNHMHMQNSRSVSLLDFKVAIELNPQQLGQNRSSLFEKISTQVFDK